MNAPSLNFFSRNHKSNNEADSKPAIIDLVVKEVVARHPWLRALGLGAFGLLGAIFLFILARLLLVSHLQGEMLDPLGRVVRRLDLSVGASRLVWYATFGWSAASLGLVMRRLAHLLLPVSLFRISFWDNLLLTCLFSVPLLGPDAAKKLYPVQTVDPAAVAWFDEAEDGSAEPHGIIGYVREEDGGFWFCNVRGGPRPTDGTFIQPVTPSVRHEWQSWLRQERDLEEKIQRAAQEKVEDQRRQTEARTQEEHNRQQAATEAKALLEKAEAERLTAVAATEKAKQERIAAESQMEKHKKESADAEANAVAEKRRAAETLALKTPHMNGTSLPRSEQEESQAKSPFHFEENKSVAVETPHPTCTVLLNEPVRMVQEREVPCPWRRCNHCAELPTSHYWLNGIQRCPVAGGCQNCGLPVSLHRHIRESVDGVIRDRIKCQK